MIAEVLQYLRPDGQRVTHRVVIPDDCQEQYDLIHSCDCMLTCEQLRNGKAVQYISNGNGDFAIVITAAGDLKAAFTALIVMIKDFNKAAFEVWNAQFEEPNGT